MGLFDNIKEKVKAKAGQAMLAVSGACATVAAVAASTGQAVATSMSDAITPVFDIFPLLIQLAILSAVFGMIGGLLIFKTRR